MAKKFCPLLVALVAVLPLATPARSASPPRDSADWIQLNGKSLEGKTQSIMAGYIVPGAIARDGHWFTVATPSGWISVVTTTDDGPRMIERYKGKRISGRVILRNGYAHLDMRPDPALARHGVVRTWTSADGRTTEAELLQADRASIRIRRKVDGAEFTVPLTSISAADRSYVEEWLRANR